VSSSLPMGEQVRERPKWWPSHASWMCRADSFNPFCKTHSSTQRKRDFPFLLHSFYQIHSPHRLCMRSLAQRCLLQARTDLAFATYLTALYLPALSHSYTHICGHIHTQSCNRHFLDFSTFCIRISFHFTSSPEDAYSG